ncbi:MAG: hypothetical protein K1X28_04200 [Parachlamydiales bacterium]|nr:hypothetical protein [Parachlamydiales bacterium]
MIKSVDSGSGFYKYALFCAVASLYNLVWGNKKVERVDDQPSISQVTKAVQTVASPVIAAAGMHATEQVVATVTQSSAMGTCPATHGMMSNALTLVSSLPASAAEGMSKAVAFASSIPVAVANGMSKAVALVSRVPPETAEPVCQAARLALPFAGETAGAAGAAGTAGATGGSFFSGFYSSAQGAAQGAFGAAKGAAQGAFGAAKGAFGFVASQLSYGQMALGAVGMLTTAYLAYRYWKGSGAVNVINSANNTNTVHNNVHFHIDPKPGMEVTQKKLKDGSVKVTVKGAPDQQLQELIQEIRAQKLPTAAPAA